MFYEVLSGFIEVFIRFYIGFMKFYQVLPSCIGVLTTFNNSLMELLRPLTILNNLVKPIYNLLKLLTTSGWIQPCERPVKMLKVVKTFNNSPMLPSRPGWDDPTKFYRGFKKF